MNRNNRRRRRRGRKPDRPTKRPEAETPTEPPKQAELVPDMGAGGELQPSEQISHPLSCGVVPNKDVFEAIQNGFNILKTTEKARDYASVLKAITAAAKLAQPQNAGDGTTINGGVHIHGEPESRESAILSISAELGISPDCFDADEAAGAG